MTGQCEESSLDRSGINREIRYETTCDTTAVIARKLSFGSDSLDGARLTAVMYSVLATVQSNGLDVQRWLTDWLTACAENGRSPPAELRPWLPWTMSEPTRRAYTRAP